MKNVFLVSVQARLTPDTNLSIESPKPVAGYYQQLGITARDEAELVRLAREFIRSDLGAEFVAVEETWVPDFEGGDAEIKHSCGEVGKIGVWYHSGRAFFSEGEEDDE